MNNFNSLNRDTMIAAGVCFSNRRLAFLTEQARWRQIRIETGKLIDGFILKAYQKLSIELLIQCGANKPTEALDFCEINPVNKAICFEANPYVAQKYTNALPENINYINVGLGSGPGELIFHIPVGNQKELSLQGSFSPAKHLNYHESFEVQVDTLDNLLPPLLDIDLASLDNLANTALLIDVEGFSWNVLQGSKKILGLESTKIIFIEVQNDNFYWENEKNARQISDFLADYDFVPIVRDYPTAPLYNIVFVKRIELDKLTQLIDSYWFDFTQIKPNFFERRNPRYYFSIGKKLLFIVMPGCFHNYLHKIFALFGSKSSASSRNGI
jgi:FkbM family methyltransferase